MTLSLLLLIGSGAALYVAVRVARRYYRKWNYAKLRSQPLSPDALDMLEKHVSLYRRMPVELQMELQGYINIFMDEKAFIGCNDFEVTDEVRLVIAANACILLLGRDAEGFRGFKTVLVYPDSYVATMVSYEGGLETISHSARAGESWFRGPVVLSWGDALRGSLNPKDGHNVVLHEFAHKLDEENNVVDGLPILREAHHYQEWAEVLTREFEELRNRVERRKNKVIDDYGASAPEEFFAVATESFFERGQRMRKYLPDLYAQFQQFYGVDPANWR
jgi:MtfA peptidase